MKKALALFSFIVFMSSCVTYKVDRIPYDSDKTFKDIIDSKSVILISELVYSDPKDEVIISQAQPKLIKDFKVENGIISGFIVDTREYLKLKYGDKKRYYDIKYFKEGEKLKNNLPKRKFRKAKEVVYLTTYIELGYGPFTLRLEDLENGTENTAATYKVNYPLSVVKNIGLFGSGGFLGFIIYVAVQLSDFDGITI